MSLSSVSRIRVRYAETDQMGVAWHGNVFAWFEVGRTDLLRELGTTYRQLEAEDVRLPVVEAHARYHRPVRYDDLVEVRTRLARHSGVRLAFEYEIHRTGAEGALVSGETSHVAVGVGGRPRRLPEGLRRLLA